MAQKKGKNFKSTKCDTKESGNSSNSIDKVLDQSEGNSLRSNSLNLIDKVLDQSEGKLLRSRKVNKQENMSHLNLKVESSEKQKESKLSKNKKNNTQGCSNNNLRKNNTSKVIRKQKSMDDFIFRKEKNIAPKENLELKKESSNNEEFEIIFENVNNTDDNLRIASVESISKKEFNGTDAIFNSNNFIKTENEPGQSLVNKNNLEKISFNEDSPVLSSHSIGSLIDLDSEDIIDVVN